MKIVIEVKDSVNADGFVIHAIEDDTIIKCEHYMYGYNASWSKIHATEEQPYVTDIIKEWCKKYGVGCQDVEVVQGMNVFANKPVRTNKVNEFIDDYLTF